MRPARYITYVYLKINERWRPKTIAAWRRVCYSAIAPEIINIHAKL